jgi:drug/metabolite transporter (DMT)-like permease
LIYLVGSIFFSSYLALSFKVVERFNIPVFQAIVFNYITCVITGSVVNGTFPITQSSFNEPWMMWALIMGTMFIITFNLIGYTVQKIGVAVTSVAHKLSLVIPFAFSIYLYNETATWIKITGVAIALSAVVLTCLPPEKGETPAHKHISGWMMFLLPALLFLGSGFVDTMVKYVEQTYLNDLNNNAYLISAFATAGLIGAILLIGILAAGKQKFDKRSIIAGIAIGIPNYFSIWCLVKVLSLYQGNSSAIIPINNMSIVLFSSVVAFIVFKEHLSLINWMGIILAIGAIALIAFG